MASASRKERRELYKKGEKPRDTHTKGCQRYLELGTMIETTIKRRTALFRMETEMVKGKVVLKPTIYLRKDEFPDIYETLPLAFPKKAEYTYDEQGEEAVRIRLTVLRTEDIGFDETSDLFALQTNEEMHGKLAENLVEALVDAYGKLDKKEKKQIIQAASMLRALASIKPQPKSGFGTWVRETSARLQKWISEKTEACGLSYLMDGLESNNAEYPAIKLDLLRDMDDLDDLMPMRRVKKRDNGACLDIASQGFEELTRELKESSFQMSRVEIRKENGLLVKVTDLISLAKTKNTLRYAKDKNAVALQDIPNVEEITKTSRSRITPIEVKVGPGESSKIQKIDPQEELDPTFQYEIGMSSLTYTRPLTIVPTGSRLGGVLDLECKIKFRKEGKITVSFQFSFDGQLGVILSAAFEDKMISCRNGKTTIVVAQENEDSVNKMLEKIQVIANLMLELQQRLHTDPGLARVLDATRIYNALNRSRYSSLDYDTWKRKKPIIADIEGNREMGIKGIRERKDLQAILEHVQDHC